MLKKKKQQEKTFLSTASYYSDLLNDATLHAILIRSEESSRSIDFITIPFLPEGYFIFTADDIPNNEHIKVFGTSFPVFAKETISYKGEPVGILVGKNLTELYDLLDTVWIAYKKAENAPVDSSLENTIIAKREVSFGNSSKEKSYDTTFQIESSYELNLDIDETTETNGALCYASGKALTVYTPTVWASNLRQNLKNITGYDAEQIIIHKTKLPITEKNAPWKNTTIAIQCAIAAMLTKKSVLLSLSHEEQELYDNYSNKVTINHSSLVSNTGKLLSCNVDILLDVGAYNPFATILVDRIAITSLGTYAAKKVTISVIAKTSNNPPTSSMLRWLDYHSFFAIENHMKEIAEITHSDPSQVRIDNMLIQGKKSQFQLDTSTYEQVLHTALEKSDFFRKYETYKLSPYTVKSKNNYFPVRGIGLATAYEPNGFLGAMIDTSVQSLEVTMEKNNQVIIKVINASNTIASIWKDIASSILSVDTKDIIIDSLYYQNEEASVPETMRSNIYITSQLLKKACLAVQKSRFHQALPITVKRTFNLASKKIWNATAFEGKPFYVTSLIALVAEIEFKIPIYSFEVKSIWISIDAGAVMNKRKARYAVQSCVKRILSQAMKNQTYAEPNISVTFLDSNDEPKQIRELVYSALPSAICNALSQVLQQTMQKYPVNQEAIFNIIERINESNFKDVHDIPIAAHEEEGDV